MSVISRQVKNKKNQDGMGTGKSGVVYDVFLRYKTPDGYKTYGKRGFSTKSEALKHEATMKVKVSKPEYAQIAKNEAKQTVSEYLETWVEQHGKANLRPSTFSGYKSHIKNHIVPFIGNVQLRNLTPKMLDIMFAQLFEKGFSVSTVRYAHRIIGVALEHARKYRYIEHNPARDIITKFGKDAKTPDPYTIDQMKQLLSGVMGTEWEMICVLSGLYGLRRSEVLGLRWNNVDLENRHFAVIEQLPFGLQRETTILEEMAPVKSCERVLPITDNTYGYFLKAKQLVEDQKRLTISSNSDYYDNNLVICRANGIPVNASRVSADFKHLLKKLEMPHIRFHDLRHTAATNMHQLTGDFYTVGEILGHTLKGIGLTLGLSTNLDAVTKQYIDVRLDRKKEVLEAYHKCILGNYATSSD